MIENKFEKGLVLGLILIIIVVISYYTSKPEYTETTSREQQRITEVIEEWNKHVNLFNNDSLNIVNLYNNWVDAYNNAIEDNQLTNTEVTQMYNATDEYAYEHRIVKQHLTNWWDFILTYEQPLKISDVDVFEARTSILNTNIKLKKNIDHMKIDTEYLIETYEEYKYQLLNIYKILIVLV